MPRYIWFDAYFFKYLLETAQCQSNKDNSDFGLHRELIRKNIHLLSGYLLVRHKDLEVIPELATIVLQTRVNSVQQHYDVNRPNSLHAPVLPVLLACSIYTCHVFSIRSLITNLCNGAFRVWTGATQIIVTDSLLLPLALVRNVFMLQIFSVFWHNTTRSLYLLILFYKS